MPRTDSPRSSQRPASVSASRHAPTPSTDYFDLPPVVALTTDVAPEIEVLAPSEDLSLVSMVNVLCDVYRANSAKPHNFKVPQPEAPVAPWLHITRKRFQDIISDILFKIVKKRKTVARLKQFASEGTFPPEYASLKPPAFNMDRSMAHNTLFLTSVDQLILDLKNEVLLSHIATEEGMLIRYQTAMHKTVVLEAYKTMAKQAHYETFHTEIANYRPCIHMVADYQFIYKSVSQVVHKASVIEKEKQDKLHAAKQRAAEHMASMSINELVKEHVRLEVKSKSKTVKKDKPKTKSSSKPKDSSKSKKDTSSSSKSKKKKGTKDSVSPGTQRSKAKAKGEPPKKKKNSGQNPLKGKH